MAVQLTASELIDGVENMLGDIKMEFCEPRMDTNGHESNTNTGSSGFPARALPSATGCLETAAAGRVAGGRPHVKTRRVETVHSLLPKSSGSKSPERRRQGVDTVLTGSAQPFFACGVLIKFDCRHGLCCTAERWRRECAGEAGRSRRSGL